MSNNYKREIQYMNVKKIVIIISVLFVTGFLILSTVGAEISQNQIETRQKRCSLIKEDKFSSNNSCSEVLSLKDDAYQYNGEEYWSEWWYFNFIDDERDIQFYLVYFLHFNRWFNFSAMVIGTFDNSNSYYKRDSYKTADFSTSYEKPDVTIGEECGFYAWDENKFWVYGQSKDGKIVWNVTYFRSSIPYYPTMPPRDLHWLCYLPAARVQGYVQLNGIFYNISGQGYHDHNWGEMVWDWQYRFATCCIPTDNVSIVIDSLGNFIFKDRIAVIIDNKTILFENPKISYSGFTTFFDFSQFVPILGIYPRKWHIYASNVDYIIDLNVSVEKIRPVFLPTLTYAIKVQVSNINGVLIRGENSYIFNVTGFSEYTRFKLVDLF